MFPIMKSSERKRIFLSPPHMCGEELRFVNEAFESNYIAPLGPMVDAFEKEFCERTGIPNSAAVSSGTAAMHLQPVSQVERHKAPASRRKEGENTIKARKVGGEVAENLFNRGLCLPS